MVAVDGDHVVLVRQFRTPLRKMMLEIPAGKLDRTAESLEATAARECEEEVGFRPGKLEHLRTIHTTAGFSNERIDIFLATDLIHVGAQPDGIEERHAEVVRLTMEEVSIALTDGSITDAKTLIGLADVIQRKAAG